MASFGFGKQTYEHNLDRETVKQWLAQIDNDLDLVLIMEYFDYGLALLAIELCWPLKDLAYLKANSVLGCSALSILDFSDSKSKSW